jgi:pantetheine-phosphate adenylyltransferase
VAIAGTFDRLHGGHKRLLTMSSIVARQHLVIGILSSHFYISWKLIALAPTPSKKHSELIQPWEHRRDTLSQFLKAIKPSLSFTIQKINRCPSAQKCSLVSGDWNEKVDAIVSEDEPDSLNGCSQLNELRGSSGKAMLPFS